MRNVSTMPNDQWLQYKASLKQQLSQMNIPVDANPAHVRTILSHMDRLHSDIRMEFAELEGHSFKVESLIRELERSKATGSNEIERKRNATIAVQQFTGNNGAEINLYDFQRTINERHLFIKGVLDTLLNKQHRLITLNGMLKLEQGTQPYA